MPQPVNQKPEPEVKQEPEVIPKPEVRERKLW